MPAASASWQTSSSRWASASTSPTGTVTALSATRPLSVTPRSTEIRSPSRPGSRSGSRARPSSWARCRARLGSPCSPSRSATPPCARMCSSAIRSSSSIDTPGSRCSPTSASVSATSAPARAMPSISCGDLRMITRRACSRRRATWSSVCSISEKTSSTVRSAWMPQRCPGGAVVLDERRRLAVVQLEAALDRLGRVVGAPLLRGALEHPVEQLLPVGDLELEDDVELAAEPAQHPVERLRLRHRAREAVEHEPRHRVAAPEAVADEADHQLVRDEVAAVVDLLQLAAEIGRELLHLPDHVAGGDVRDPVRRRDPLRLGSLARALRAEEENVHYRRKPS